MYSLEKKILELKVKNNISFKDARSQIYSSNTELVLRIPRLQHQPKIQYSTVSAKPALPNDETIVEKLTRTITAQQKQIDELTKQLSQLMRKQQKLPSKNADVKYFIQTGQTNQPSNVTTFCEDTASAASHGEDIYLRQKITFYMKVSQMSLLR